MNYEIIKKERKIYTLDEFVSVPKVFLALPFFNTKRAADQFNDIQIGKFQDMKNIKLKALNMSIFNDFEYFLFIYKTMLKTRSKVIEFDNNEMLDKLQVAKNHRTTYFNDYFNSIEKMSTMIFQYEQDKARKGFSFFTSYSVDRKKSRFEFSDQFVSFFNDLRELYEIDFRVLSKLKTEYQRILYVLYVCNRMNKINVFSIEMLKQRFLVDKTEDKKFIFNVRKANEELKLLGLISSFEEEKEGRKTTAFKIEYNYKKLYQRSDKNDFSGFEDSKKWDVKLEQEKEEKQTANVDDDYIDESEI
ncbi:replication initiation protein [Salmonella enterica subsp. enterica]|nr:replication initiation protein [Salmonella enterica subsp. enterica]